MTARRPLKVALPASVLLLLALGCGSNSVAPVGSSPAQPGYPAASTQRWLRQFASTSAPPLLANQSNPPTDALPAIAGTRSGGVVLAGYTLGTYPGFANPLGTAQAVVVRYDALGNQQWITQFGTGAGDFLLGVATDSAENIYVAGTSLGSYPGQNTSGNPSALLVKLDPRGNRLWLRQFNPGSGNADLSSIAVDAADNLFVAGTVSPVPANGTRRAYAMRIDPATGATLWTSQYGASGVISSVNALAAAAGAVYLAGSNLTAGTASQVTTDILRLDSATGAAAWSQNMATGNTASIVTAIALTSDGSPVIAGSSSSAYQILVGYGADPSATAFVTRLDAATGQPSWSLKVASGAGDQITSISSAAGALYAAGFTNGSLSASFNAQRSGEFLLKVSPTGQPVWVQQFGTGIILNITVPYGLAAASDGSSIYLSAPTQRAFPGFTQSGLIQNVVSSWSP